MALAENDYVVMLIRDGVPEVSCACFSRNDLNKRIRDLYFQVIDVSLTLDARSSIRTEGGWEAVI